MKRVLFLLGILMLVSSSAISITEFESNPVGDDKGNEWIEFYSENEINISGYKIVNNDGDEIELNFSFKGFYVYVFEKQWLDNSDEKVYLYRGDELIYETDIFADSSNDDFTWQFCGEWKFLNSTKIKECKEIEDDDEEKEDTNNETSEAEEEQDEEREEEDYKNIKNTKYPLEEIVYETNNTREILKASKTIKSEKNTENLDKSTYAGYGLVAFCLLLLILFVKNKGKYKNEFR